jgi:3-isopropylmalate dehydrogenase
MNNGPERNRARLVSYLGGIDHTPAASVRPLIGVLEGTGIGHEVIGSALQVLAAIGQVTGINFEVRRGALIGEDALTHFGQWLPEEVVEFCSEVFRLGGAILSGPGGGRYVYDLRRRFDLFSKFVPIKPWPELAGAGRMVPHYLQGVDILLIRDNIGGVYQGEGSQRITDRGKVAEHSFSYSEWEVQRIVEVAARAAADRRGSLHVVIKDGGIPGMSALWRDVGTAATRKHGVETSFINVDLAAYELIQNAARFDVIVAPNLFGDILADIAGVLVSSRGVTFSGNFNSEGHGVFQTNHGSAHDLAGTDTANPAGQILSLAMLLRESLGLHQAAEIIEASLAEVWRQGFRTADLAEPGCEILGTNGITERFVQQILRAPEVKSSHETCAATG